MTIGGGSVKRGVTAGFIAVVAVFALVAAGCGGKKSSGGGEAAALPASSCSDIYYEGSGKPQYLIASDLPLQGSGRTQTVQMTEAIKFILKQHDFKAGKYTVGYQSCDDATAQLGKWASEKCSANANAYANNKAVVGVIGTFNSGCAVQDRDLDLRATGVERADDADHALVEIGRAHV